MFRPRVSKGSMLAVFALVAGSAACEPIPTGTLEGEGTPDRVVMLQSTGGAFLPKDEMQVRLNRLTRAFAIALVEEEFRAQVYRSLRDSPFTEGKRHLRTMLSSDWSSLMPKLAEVSDRSIEDILADLDRLVDLEIYVPVPRHRDAWTGGGNLIVASTLGDDGHAPVGFLVGGDPVQLSGQTPPETPVLILTFVETDFSRIPNSTARTESTTALSETPGVWMRFFSALDDHESWPNGAPEYEVHAFAGNAPPAPHINCAGQAASGDSYWDWNGESPYGWSGDVLLISESEMADSIVEFQVWEDDIGGCLTPKASANVKEGISFQFDDNTIYRGGWSPPDIAWIQTALETAIDLVTIGQEDDYIGTFQFPLEGCWPEASGALYTDGIAYGSGGHTAYALIDVTFGEREPLCELSVSISGPTAIEDCATWPAPDPEPNYHANVTGGSGTISYEWREDGVTRGYSSSYTLYDQSEGGHSLDLLVTRGGDFGIDQIVVEIDELDPMTCGMGF